MWHVFAGLGILIYLIIGFIMAGIADLAMTGRNRILRWACDVLLFIGWGPYCVALLFIND
jgi:hypothetical protein